MLVTNEEITKFLPHREPFLFIDKIVEIELGKSIHCIKNNKPSEDFFRGHFPNNPVMPGVIILEALAQASGILGFKTMNKTSGLKTMSKIRLYKLIKIMKMIKIRI